MTYAQPGFSLRKETYKGSFTLATTKALPPSDRFDYWRHLFFGSYIDRQRSDLPIPFKGDILHSSHHDGVLFANLRADPIVCRFGMRDSGLVLLGRIRSGMACITEKQEQQHVLSKRDGLLLFDCDRPAITTLSHYDISYLVFPRYFVENSMGCDPAPSNGALRKIPEGPIARMLISHLDAMADFGSQLSPSESFAAIKAATEMAIAVFSRFHPQFGRDDAAINPAMTAAARQYIALNFARHELTSDKVAAALGCSRAHLYRLFAESGQTVAGYLRDVRLEQARRLLQCEGGMNIGAIAFDCGYTDVSAFSKAFKRRYGEKPSDYRAASGAVLQ